MRTLKTEDLEYVGYRLDLLRTSSIPYTTTPSTYDGHLTSVVLLALAPPYILVVIISTSRLFAAVIDQAAADSLSTVALL